ncbi:MAG: UDP-N-acetylmuramoyl-tripeptide--D-alanyl-D-alanine ligase [Pseudomonadota bacterium]
MQSTLAQCQSWVVDSSMTTDGNANIDGVSTDSRTAAAGSLFVALRGERFDSHDFLRQVADRGVAAIMVEKSTPGHKLDGLQVPLLMVPDSRIALGQVAHGWRDQFSLPIIGVTGSNGKTTVKEMIAAILAAGVGTGHSMATRGNFNNDIGVPLTLLRINADTRAAVVELGMNHPGEIGYLSALARPVVGLVNNAQREHQEFMATVEAVALENGAVIDSLPDDGVAVFPADDVYTPLWRSQAAARGKRRVITFGLNDQADVHCTYVPNVFGSDLRVVAGENAFSICLGAAGEHNVRNALAAIACTLAINMPAQAIVRGLESFVPVAGRLQRKLAANGALVIDDTYNANPDSVRAAIDVLAQAAAPRVLVLGDMGEVGDNGQVFHEEIGDYARTCGIDKVLTLGQLAAHTAQAFDTDGVSSRQRGQQQGMHFSDIDALQHTLDKLATPDAAILIKGSRFMKMERVVQHLLGQPVQESH